MTLNKVLLPDPSGKYDPIGTLVAGAWVVHGGDPTLLGADGRAVIYHKII